MRRLILLSAAMALAALALWADFNASRQGPPTATSIRRRLLQQLPQRTGEGDGAEDRPDSQWELARWEEAATALLREQRDLDTAVAAAQLALPDPEPLPEPDEYMPPPYEPPLYGEYEPPLHVSAAPLEGSTHGDAGETEQVRVRVHVRIRHRRASHRPPPVRTVTTAVGKIISSGPDACSVALCLTVKDHHWDIVEWLDWHLAIGVDKIYVFDMGSAVPLNETVTAHIDAGIVSYHYVDQTLVRRHTGFQPQLQVYDTCLQEFRHRHAWMGFIDSDEFVVMKDPQLDLPTFLQDYDSYGALAVNWVMFSSSGHVRRPVGGVVRNYWRCMPTTSPHSLHVKVFVNTRYVNRPQKDPHTFSYLHGRFAVNELSERVHGPATWQHSSDSIALHHYVLKSRDEWQMKMARGSAMGNHKDQHFFDAIDAEAEEHGSNCTAAIDILASRQSPSVT